MISSIGVLAGPIPTTDEECVDYVELSSATAAPTMRNLCDTPNQHRRTLHNAVLHITARFSVSAAAMKKLHGDIDHWKRFVVVHRVSTWFGRYWGVNDGKWNENNFLREHFFHTKDRGPYYLRAYTGNCMGHASNRKWNTVVGPTMTVAIYTNATDATPIWLAMGAMLLFLFIYVMVKADYFFT